jgi:hypothetical protein
LVLLGLAGGLTSRPAYVRLPACFIQYAGPNPSSHSPSIHRRSLVFLARSAAALSPLLPRRNPAFRRREDGWTWVRRPSSSSVPRSPTTSSLEEVSSPALTAEQTDPFECCSVNPCPRCAFYQRRRWRTTGAGRASSMASDGAGGRCRIKNTD